MSYDDFPTISTRKSSVQYPVDEWSDPDVVTQFDDQISVEVQSAASDGFWSNLTVVITCTETDADTIFAFLRAHRLRGIPFYFTHRKRGRILVRYWPNSNPPSLPYRRAIAGKPDIVQFELPLRQEAGT